MGRIFSSILLLGTGGLLTVGGLAYAGYVDIPVVGRTAQSISHFLSNLIPGDSSVSGLLKQMPQNSMGVVVLKDVPDFAKNLGIVGDDNKLIPEIRFAMRDGISEQERQSFIQIFGADPTTDDGLQKLGVRWQKPWGQATISLPNQSSPLYSCQAFYIPVDDPAGLAEKISRSENAGQAMAYLDAQGEKLFYGSRTSSKDTTVMGARGDWLAMVEVRGGAGTESACINSVFHPTSSVLDAPWYANAKKEQKGDWHVWAGLSGAEFFSILDEYTENKNNLPKNSLESSVAARLYISADSWDIHSDIVGMNTVGITNQKGDTADQLAKRMPGQTLAALRIALDLPSIVNNPQIKSAMQDDIQLNAAQNDLVNQFASPMSLAVWSDPTTRLFNIGGALWIPLRSGADVNRLHQFFSETAQEENVALVPAQLGKTQWHIADESELSAGYAIAENHLIIAVGRGTMQNIAQSLDQGGQYLDDMSPKEIRSAMQKDGDMAFYFDVDRSFAFFDQSNSMTKFAAGRQNMTALRELQRIDSIISTTESDQQHSVSSFRVVGKNAGDMRALSSTAVLWLMRQ